MNLKVQNKKKFKNLIITKIYKISKLYKNKNSTIGVQSCILHMIYSPYIKKAYFLRNYVFDSKGLNRN